MKISQKPFGLVTMLESYNEVIAVAHGDHIALCLLLPPLPDPQVEYIVKVDVGQKRTNTAALNCCFLSFRAASRIRSSALDTPPRLWVRSVVCSSVFPSANSLPSILSVALCRTLFKDFLGTVELSDFP